MYASMPFEKRKRETKIRTFYVNVLDTTIATVISKGLARGETDSAFFELTDFRSFFQFERYDVIKQAVCALGGGLALFLSSFFT